MTRLDRWITTADRWLRIAPLRVRSLFRRRAVERELDDELAYHVERQAELFVARGMTPAAARSEALRGMGGVEFRKEQVRDTRGTRGIEELGGDLAFALRTLRRSPAFAATVVLTLALGIGANTAMFTLLRGTLLRPLPNREGERLVYLRQSASGATQADVSFSVPEVADLRAATRTLGAIAEYSSMAFTLVGSSGEPSRVLTGIVSGNYFDVLGLAPALGRLTSAADDGPAAAPVVVLSHDYWMAHFGGDPAVVGRTVRINDQVATVLGVVQPAPHWPGRTDVFVNLVTSPHHLSATMVTERAHRMTDVFARLAPGRTVREARDDVARAAAAMVRTHPDAYPADARYAVTLLPLRDAVNERASTMFWLLMGAAAFVLLIACANVANLTLMRGVGREREMLVRAALGAGRARLRRLLLAENLVLALLGGALGVLVALAGVRLLVAFAAQLTPRAGEIRVDAVVLAVGLATSLLAAVVLSFVPRVGGDRALASSLAPAGQRTTLGRGRQQFQRALVVTQLAVCMVLLTGAGLLVRTIGKLDAVESGVRTERVLTLDLPFEGSLEAMFTGQSALLAGYERIRDRVAAVPGVDVVSAGSQAPLRPTTVSFEVKAEGQAAPDGSPPMPGLRTADPTYFMAAGIPILAGRGFETTDRAGAPLVVVLNETLARRLFGDANPIGRRVAWTGEVLKFSPLSGAWRTVVGVVRDTRDQGLDAEPQPAMFSPFAQEFVFGATLVVRTAADPATLQPSILAAVREVAPRQLVSRVATLEEIRDQSVAPRRLNALFVAAFGALALVIATVGIAGVLAFSVSARTNEIGIRMSLGADTRRVLGMVLGEGSALLAAGLAVGTVGALLGARLLRGLLFGVTPNDPLTLAAVALVLGAVGLAACCIPAARAARVDPAVALRAE